jgi:DNA-directed RNA polymerase subunit H (RpoH/RPB5)
MSVNKLFKSREVIVDMIELRRYDATAYSNFSVNEIETMFKASEKKTTAELGALDITVANKLGSKLYVKYLLASKLRVNNFKSLIDEMINNFLKEGDEVVFVLKDKINNMESFNNMLEIYLTTHNIFIQIFCLDNLMFNIMNHMYVPKMRVVSPEDKERILESYSANSSQFPKILKSDPPAKFLGVRKGDLCQITRVSETAGTYISYRICV